MPPRIVFTELEQELIRGAVNAIPEAFPDLRDAHGGHTRGAQYRHLILDYVRNHPSELTPYAAASHTRRQERRK